MGFRYQKRIKIIPGVKLNVSKNGISSVSLGKRGSSININKNGTRVTAGIPGSGMSYSTKRSKIANTSEADSTCSYAIEIEQILHEKEHCLNMIDIAGITIDNSLRKNVILRSKKQKQMLILNEIIMTMTKEKNNNVQMQIQVEQILKKYNLIRFAKSINFVPSELSIYQATIVVYIETNNHLSKVVRKQLIKDTIDALVK